MKHCPLQFMVPFSAIKGFLDILPHGQALPFCGDSQKYPRYVFLCSTKCAGLFSLKISQVIEILIVPLSVLQLRKIFKSMRSWQFLAGTQDQDILFVYRYLKAHLRFFTTLLFEGYK